MKQCFKDCFLIYTDLLPPARSFSCTAERKCGRKNVFSLPGTATATRDFKQWVILSTDLLKYLEFAQNILVIAVAGGEAVIQFSSMVKVQTAKFVPIFWTYLLVQAAFNTILSDHFQAC